MRLSVITVTYNATDTLARTLTSVREQTYPNIKHIIVDGNSTDGTVEMIREYANANTKWISEPDKGLYFAMNKAVALSDGDYLCFLNAGDTFYDKDTVEKMMSSFDENMSPDIIYGETAIVDFEGKYLHMRRLEAPKQLSFKSFKKGMLVCHQAFIVKRNLCNPYNTAYKYSSDFDWAINVMKHAECIHNTNLILINYLNEGLTTANHKASLKERFNIMVKHYGLVSTVAHHMWFAVRAIFK